MPSMPRCNESRRKNYRLLRFTVEPLSKPRSARKFLVTLKVHLPERKMIRLDVWRVLLKAYCFWMIYIFYRKKLMVCSGRRFRKGRSGDLAQPRRPDLMH